MTWLTDIFAYLLCVAAALALRLWVLSFVRVQGRSMTPTLMDRDWLFVWRLPYRFRKPQRQDVVICHYPAKYRAERCPLWRLFSSRPIRGWRRLPIIPQSFVKRVIGVPGDTVEVIEGAVHVNGEPLAEPYLDAELCRLMQERAPITLGRDEYFVLGDNRDHSSDSRRVGPLRRREIRGRVVCILSPGARRGRIR